MIKTPVAASSVPPPEQNTLYPQPFAALMEGRLKRKLGDFFGLSNFGINLTRLSPGGISALLHHHSRQDEFIYILEGTPTLMLGEQEFLMQPGDCFGIQAGTGVGSQLINNSAEVVAYLEIGDRSAGDEAAYPNDDLKAKQAPDGQWVFTHKDGRPY